MNTYPKEILIFHPQHINKPIHWVSDIGYWKNIFHREAEMNREHRRKQKVLIDNNNEVLKREINVKSLSEEQQAYVRSMTSFIEYLREEQKEYNKCAKICLESKNFLHAHKDKWNKHVTCYNEQIKYLRHKLTTIAGRIDVIKDLYHKTRLLADVQAHKLKTSLKQPEEECKAQKKLDATLVRVAKLRATYHKAIEVWHERAAETREISFEYEQAFCERELERAELILHELEKMRIPTNKRQTGCSVLGDIAFSNIDAREVIEFIATGEDFFINMECPRFQEYQPIGDIEAMYEAARREFANKVIEINPKHDLDGLDDVDYDIDVDIDSEGEATMADDELNRILNKYKKCKYFIVTKGYKKCDVTEISLKIGERVKQLLPANSKGMALGEVVHGILHKKKRGFYPVGHTQQVTTATGDDKSAENENLKLVQKVQKKIKKIKSEMKSKSKRSKVSKSAVAPSYNEDLDSQGSSDARPKSDVASLFYARPHAG